MLEKHQPYLAIVPFWAVLLVAWEAATSSGGPGKKYSGLQGLCQACGTKAESNMEKCASSPLSHTVHLPVGNTASGCCFS